MTRKLLLLILLSVGFASLAPAQSWRKLKKEAEQAYQDGQLSDAADKYEQAWRKKRKKEDLIHQAGELYYQLRDYRKAAEAYRPIKEKNGEFPLVGLKYARCLKQDGQYDRAITEFEAFMDGYAGDGKDILQEIIQNEIAGCRLGMNAPASADRDVELLLPGDGINSDKDEFAPYPVSDNELYYSSTIGDRARIYSSQRTGSTWSKGEPPRNFPVIQSGHFCNGSMAPDGSRLYFTVCSNTQGPWNDVKTRCEIFVTKRIGAVWSQPERLPDYINMAGVTATHPFAVHQRGQELLFYASNREGGRGGMDLWYTSRDLGADNIDFTLPVNLGPVVNTLGDEITPFYNTENQTLYFASNGHVSIGGFDIFSAIGDEVSWSQPDNLGMPVNSSADEYFYILNPSRTGGFLTSNRVFAGGKPTTTHEDIFEFAVGGRRVMVKGNVYDRQSGEPINDINVALYQVADDGRETELIARSFSDGNYSYEILPNRRFRVEVKAYGYEPGSYRFSSDDMNTFTYGQPIFLAVEGTAGVAPSPDPTYPGEPANPTAAPDRPVKAPAMNTPAGAPYTARGRGPNDTYEYQTTAPRHNGTYYKIQLAAVGSFKEDRFSNVAPLGRIDTELILARGLTRVLVADFFSLAEARSALQQVKSKGYSGAYIVEYIDGERYTKVQ
ncbi:MAG: PD40 domain-containing protein [Lewinellaceae bacterium]|nr:PD40 domain-containing protein [Phaeodactylibacter sp.]MCB9036988.1 PD40 domain-containing protein [Lewinellaceae bacterium]